MVINQKVTQGDLLNNEVVRLLLENTTMGIMICNSSGVIQIANHHISKKLDFDLNDIVLRNINDIISLNKNQAQAGKLEMKDLFTREDTHSSRSIIVDAQKKDGQKIELRAHVNTGILQEEFFLICFLENSPLSEKVNQNDKDFLYNNLKEANSNLAGEVDRTNKVNIEIKKSLEYQKKHGEFRKRFVSVASHEFRTPLGGILTSASLLEQYNVPGFEEQRLKHIKIIKNQTRNLTSILNDFLSFDSLDRPEVRVNLKMFCLQDFFKDTIPSIEKLTSAYNRIRYYQKGSDTYVYQSPDLLNTIITHLVSNALKYSNPNDEVIITTEFFGKNLVINITDQGIGIPEEAKSHIMELFFRAENTSGTYGTGLGLNIAQMSLKLIRGEMTFKSTMNEGSIFTLTIPKDLEE